MFSRHSLVGGVWRRASSSFGSLDGDRVSIGVRPGRARLIPERALARPMSLFRDLGRKVERFKRDAGEAADEEAAYECVDCGERFHAEREECPECGSEDVEARE